MTDLVTTGPDLLDLRFGQTTEQLDGGRSQRTFLPLSHHQAERGYLHPGVAAAFTIGAARICAGLPLPLTSVALSFQRRIPLGHDLRAVVDDQDDGRVDIELRVVEDQGWDADPIGVLAHGEVRGGDPAPLPDRGELRSFATAPLPRPEEHTAHTACFVCGTDNPQGLDLTPGWHAPDTVLTGFTAGPGLAEGRAVSVEALPILTTCPTLLANRLHLDELGAPGAVAVDLEVRFHGDVAVPTTVRAVGQAAAEPGLGEQPRHLVSTDDRRLRGSGALVTEDGQVLATSMASWDVVDELPERDAGGVPPVDAFTPLKGGRPEERSSEDWGRSLPGRREAPGPRSEGDREELPSPRSQRQDDA